MLRGLLRGDICSVSVLRSLMEDHKEVVSMLAQGFKESNKHITVSPYTLVTIYSHITPPPAYLIRIDCLRCRVRSYCSGLTGLKQPTGNI